MENLIKSVFARTAMFAAKMVAPAVQANYMPLGLAPDGASTVAQLTKLREEARTEAATTTKTLLKTAVTTKSDQQSVDIKANFRKVREAFEGFTRADPDQLASMLVLQMCDGMHGLDDFDNQRRVVQTWSAILAPSIVIRERDGVALTATGMIESALMWVEHGYTKDAMLAHSEAKSRFIAAHPARMYTLLADTASQHKVDHQKLMFSMVHPVIKALASFEGSMKVLADADIEAEEKSRG